MDFYNASYVSFHQFKNGVIYEYLKATLLHLHSTFSYNASICNGSIRLITQSPLDPMNLDLITCVC